MLLLDVIHAIGIISTIVGTLSTTGFIAYGYFKRSYFGTVIRNQRDIATELQAYKKKEATATERATNAEGLNDTFRPLVAELRLELEKLRGDVNVAVGAIKPLQEKVDAMVDWAHFQIEYTMKLEQVAREAGLAHEGSMPVIPDVMKDRFNIPESLR
jgi:hypothetical protein